MTVNEIAELVSLALTVPTIIFALLVIYLWIRDANTSLCKLLWVRRKKCDWFLGPCVIDKGIIERDPEYDLTIQATDWFILGVLISFTGSLLDNLYWAVPWMLVFIGSEAQREWIQAGVFFDIPFRQIAGILAAFCHVKAAVIYGRQHRILVVGVVASIVLTILLVIVLLAVKFRV